MTNPVLVTATRGGRLESVHRGAAVAVDSEGQVIFSIGNPNVPVFPRSGIKAMQALLLVESGAADAFGFGDAELALACSSHSGEPHHVACAANMLAAAGCDQKALECGSHWPFNIKVSTALARSGGQPTALYNNCSGKHAGFICAARHLGHDPAGYINYDHPVQVMIREVLTDLIGGHFGIDNCGTDGCSIPTYATPLSDIAYGFAKMVSGMGLQDARSRAAHRLIDACMNEPLFVAGTNRACTRLMTASPGRIFAKTGAEGVFCAALPRQGIGIAVKCDDGTSRAAETIVAAILARLASDNDEALAVLRDMSDRAITNWNGVETGRIQVTEILSEA